MRPTELVRDAFRNLRGQHLVAALALGIASLAAVIPDVAAVDAGVQEFGQQVAAGGAVWLIESETGTDLTRCERLSLGAGIRRSGSVVPAAFGEPATLSFRQSPGVEFGVLSATPGLVGIAIDGPPPPTRGVAVGDGLIAELGASPTELWTDDGVYLPVVAVMGAPRDLGFGRDVILPRAPLHGAGTCWVELEPWAPTTLAEAATQTISPADASAQVVPNRRTPVDARATVERLEHRSTRFAGPAGAGALAFLHLGWAWLRRTDLAVYRLSGTRWADRTVVLGLEHLTASLTGGVLAATVVAHLAETPDGFEVGLWGVAMATMLGAAASLVALGLVALRPPEAALTD